MGRNTGGRGSFSYELEDLGGDVEQAALGVVQESVDEALKDVEDVVESGDDHEMILSFGLSTIRAVRACATRMTQTPQGFNPSRKFDHVEQTLQGR